MPFRVVLDTSVLIAGLYSRRGAMLGGKAFEIIVSVPLVLEYEAVAKAKAPELGLTHGDVDDVIDYLCSVADRREIFFLWRPFLRDPGDDMVLEVAVEAGCEFIVTHNLRDFSGSERFRVRPVSPGDFLRLLGG